MINMAGMDWGSGPAGGIYLMGHDTSAAQVARGGGGLMGSQKIKGWDGGRFIPGDVRTSAEALALTGLDWEVDRHPIVKVEPIYGVTAKGPGVIGWDPIRGDGAMRTAKGSAVNDLPTGGWDIAESHVMNVRRDTGKVLGVVGPGWRGPQNRECFTWMDDLVDSGDAKWVGGGEQDGGKRIWLCAQLDRAVVLGGEESELSVPLAFLSNAWDGTLSLGCTIGCFRLACVNGQSIPLEGFVRQWRGRHTAGLTAEKRLAIARKTLELSIGYFDAWAVEMEKLMTRPISTFRVERTIKDLFPDAELDVEGNVRVRAQNNVLRARESVLTIYRTAPDLQHLGHTDYRFMNAVTEYADWHVKCPADRQMLRSAEPSKVKDTAFKLLAANA
jgi:phage/plasmid-like protein (TIGR03299 family)